METDNLVFKYSRWDEYCKEALRERYFWFSKPTYFNDPFDSNMDILLAFEETKKLFVYEDKSQLPPLDNPFACIKERTNSFGILCFTRPSSLVKIGDKGYNNLHFWSHYADSHKGISLGFDETKIESYYSEKLECSASLKPVDYKIKPVDIDNEEIVLERKGSYIRSKKVPGIFGPYSNERDQETFFENL